MCGLVEAEVAGSPCGSLRSPAQHHHWFPAEPQLTLTLWPATAWLSVQPQGQTSAPHLFLPIVKGLAVPQGWEQALSPRGQTQTLDQQQEQIHKHQLTVRSGTYWEVIRLFKTIHHSLSCQPTPHRVTKLIFQEVTQR